MKAIVVIFVRTRDVKLPAGQSLAISTSASSQEVAVAGADKTNRADKSTIHKESAPPFWTWFIENPRPTRQGTWQKRHSTEVLTDLLVYA